MSHPKAICVTLLVSALVVASGAAAKKKSQTLSDFLGDTSDLTPLSEKDDLLVYRKAPGVLAGYGKIYLATPLLYFDPTTLGQGVDPDELRMLVDFLRSEVVEALEEEPTRYRVVDGPGAGVLVVRSAITGVEPVDPKKNIAATAAGIALGVGLLVPRVDLGGASIEVEMLDGETGERLIAVAATRTGRRMLGKIRGTKEWGDVKGAFKSWAKAFRKALDRANETTG
jgi:Protein of unknown function (DUF3313)